MHSKFTVLLLWFIKYSSLPKCPTVVQNNSSSIFFYFKKLPCTPCLCTRHRMRTKWQIIKCPGDPCECYWLYVCDLLVTHLPLFLRLLLRGIAAPPWGVAAPCWGVAAPLLLARLSSPTKLIICWQWDRKLL